METPIAAGMPMETLTSSICGSTAIAGSMPSPGRLLAGSRARLRRSTGRSSRRRSRRGRRWRRTSGSGRTAGGRRARARPGADGSPCRRRTGRRPGRPAGPSVHVNMRARRRAARSCSSTVPVAIAPPAHMEINARVPSVRSSSCSAVVIRRVPVEPTGWPSAIAPPLTLVRSSGGAGLLRPGEYDGRERLVDLEQVEVVERHAGALEQPPGRVDGSVEVVVGIRPDQGVVGDPRARGQPERVGERRSPSAAPPRRRR